MVGIDPSLTALGICALSHYHYRTWLLKPKKTGVERLREIQHGVQDVLFEIGIDRVDLTVLEGYSFASQSQQHKIGEGGGAIKLALLDTFGPKQDPAFPYVVAPSTLKKFVLGIGKGDKNQILKGIYKKWNVDIDNDNEADAYALAQWGWAKKYGPQLKYEEETMSKYTRENEK